MEGRVQFTVSRTCCVGAVRHSFYLVISDLEEGQKVMSYRAQPIPSLCVEKTYFLGASFFLFSDLFPLAFLMYGLLKYPAYDV